MSTSTNLTLSSPPPAFSGDTTHHSLADAVSILLYTDHASSFNSISVVRWKDALSFMQSKRLDVGISVSKSSMSDGGEGEEVVVPYVNRKYVHDPAEGRTECHSVTPYPIMFTPAQGLSTLLVCQNRPTVGAEAEPPAGKTGPDHDDNDISNATNRAYVFKVHDSAGGETERSANERDQGMTTLPFIPLNHLPSLLKKIEAEGKLVEGQLSNLALGIKLYRSHHSAPDTFSSEIDDKVISDALKARHVDLHPTAEGPEGGSLVDDLEHFLATLQSNVKEGSLDKDGLQAMSTVKQYLAASREQGRVLDWAIADLRTGEESVEKAFLMAGRGRRSGLREHSISVIPVIKDADGQVSILITAQGHVVSGTDRTFLEAPTIETDASHENAEAAIRAALKAKAGIDTDLFHCDVFTSALASKDAGLMNVLHRTAIVQLPLNTHFDPSAVLAIPLDTALEQLEHGQESGWGLDASLHSVLIGYGMMQEQAKALEDGEWTT